MAPAAPPEVRTMELRETIGQWLELCVGIFVQVHFRFGAVRAI